MSERRLRTDSQCMRRPRPFSWLLLLGIACSLAGLYRVLETSPARAATPASKASAAGERSTAVAYALPTTVTEATPGVAGPSTAEVSTTPAAVAAVAGVAAAPTATPESATPATITAAASRPETLPSSLTTPTVVPLVAAPGKATALLDLMNAARTEAGLSALARDAALDEVALTRARNLVANGYFDHYAPDGESAFSELAARGIRYRLAGENLARNNYVDGKTVEAAFEALMASPGHRANILEERFAAVGVAAVQSGKMWLYVTVFTS